MWALLLVHAASMGLCTMKCPMRAHPTEVAPRQAPRHAGWEIRSGVRPDRSGSPGFPRPWRELQGLRSSTYSSANCGKRLSRRQRLVATATFGNAYRCNCSRGGGGGDSCDGNGCVPVALVSAVPNSCPVVCALLQYPKRREPHNFGESRLAQDQKPGRSGASRVRAQRCVSHDGCILAMAQRLACACAHMCAPAHKRARLTLVCPQLPSWLSSWLCAAGVERSVSRDLSPSGRLTQRPGIGKQGTGGFQTATCPRTGYGMDAYRARPSLPDRARRAPSRSRTRESPKRQIHRQPEAQTPTPLSSAARRAGPARESRSTRET